MREGGGGRRPWEGGTRAMAEARGAREPSIPRSPPAPSSIRTAPAWPPCPGRGGDPGRDLGPDRAGGTPGGAAGTPPCTGPTGPSPQCERTWAPPASSAPRGARGPQLKSQPLLLPGARPLWDAASGEGEDLPGILNV